jgi:hypothetical protein
MTINKRSGKYKIPKENTQGKSLEDMIDASEEIIDNKIDEGEFDIQVKAVGSLDYQKQKSMAFWLQLMGSDPRFPGLIADLVAEESDADKSKQIADRLKTLLPLEIKAQESGEPMPPPQPDPAMQMQEQKMQLDQKALEMKWQEMMQNAQLKQKQMEIDEMKLANEHTKMMLDAQQHGLDAQLAQEQTIADIHQTRAKAEAEITKGQLGLETAHVVHHTHRMKEMSKLHKEVNT